MNPLVAPAVNKLLLLGASAFTVVLFWWFPFLYERAYLRRIPDLSALDDRSAGITIAMLLATLTATVYGQFAFLRLRSAARQLGLQSWRHFKLAGWLLLAGVWSWLLWLPLWAGWMLLSKMLRS